MDVLSVYEYILSRISEDLTPYGYQRSGKSALFYRYSIDKKIGCAFEIVKCAKYLDKQAHKKEGIVAKEKTYSG